MMKNIVDYSSSDTEEEEKLESRTVQSKTTKLPRRLPMLLQIENEKKDESNLSVDHQMRVRSILHVEGNWATHVFIDCRLNSN